jgi:hypothetical protein
MLVSCLVYSSTLKMDATGSSETSIDFHRSIRRYITEDRILRNHRCENLISCTGNRRFSLGDIEPAGLSVVQCCMSSLQQGADWYVKRRSESLHFRARKLSETTKGRRARPRKASQPEQKVCEDGILIQLLCLRTLSMVQVLHR